MSIRQFISDVMELPKAINAVNETIEGGGMTKLDKALQNIAVVKRILVENSCPSEFGLKDCEYNPGTGCSSCCEDCWNEEVTE